MTNKLIVLYYPMWTGGKTIINALSLADNALMFDEELALKQINGNLTQQDKFNELIKRLKANEGNPKRWDDLRMGELQHIFEFSDNPGHPDINYMLSMIKKVQESNNFYFVGFHENFQQIEDFDRRFGVSNIIVLHNIKNFLFKRHVPPTPEINEYSVDDERLILWDTNLFFDGYLEKLEEIYRTIGLTNFNSDLISKYIEAWKKIILFNDE